MELVVTKVERGIDWLEWLEVDIDLAFLAIFCQDSASVDHQAIWGHL